MPCLCVRVRYINYSGPEMGSDILVLTRAERGHRDLEHRRPVAVPGQHPIYTRIVMDIS